ncbi:MAG: hypothetical protein AAGD10_12095 [Myxococcota bacterium]
MALLFLQNTVEVPAALARNAEVWVVDQYAFRAQDMDGVSGVLFSQHLDEQHLAEHQALWDGFLDRGGALAIQGPVHRPFVSAAGAFLPVKAGLRAEGWILEMATPHAITAGVRPEDLSLRRGVIGFWGRGYLQPVVEATVLTRFRRSGAPVDWCYVSPSGGRLFVHPGNDVWSFSSQGARRLSSQLMAWMGGA